VLLITYFDWFGSPDDLEKFTKAWEKACDETSGMNSTKLYTSHQARYHYAWVTDADSYEALMKANSLMPERDRNVMTHAVIEVLSKM